MQCYNLAYPFLLIEEDLCVVQLVIIGVSQIMIVNEGVDYGGVPHVPTGAQEPFTKPDLWI